MSIVGNILGTSSPKPPDPFATAAAQAQANREAVRESALVNQINQITPFGTEKFTGEIGTPDRTRTITLNPADQANLDRQRAIASGLFGLGQQVIPQAGAAVGSPLSFAGLPGISGAGDLANQAQALEQATFQRGMNLLQPRFEQERAALESRLINQGLPIGSEAFGTGFGNLQRSQNEALENLALSSVGAGRAEQSRLFGLEQAARQQAIAELLTQRGQPLNELAALIQGAPAINLPNFQAPAQFGVQPPNIADLIQQNFAIQSQQAGQRQGDILGGLFGLGSAAILGGFNPFAAAGGLGPNFGLF